MNKISRTKLAALKAVEQEQQTKVLPKVDGHVFVTRSGELHIVVDLKDVGRFDPEEGFVHLAEIRESGQDGDKKGYTEFGIEARPKDGCLPITMVDPESNILVKWAIRTNAACMATVRLVYSGMEPLAKPALVSSDNEEQTKVA